MKGKFNAMVKTTCKSISLTLILVSKKVLFGHDIRQSGMTKDVANMENCYLLNVYSYKLEA